MERPTTSDSESINQVHNRLPPWFWAGIALVAIMWPVAWLQIQPISDNYFFPLWLGFILTIDGMVVLRTGTSPITRSGIWFATLFALSIPLWWLFEAFNQVLDNWQYHLPAEYGRLSYGIRASIAFSTVVPAVFVATEFIRSFRLNLLRSLPELRLGTGTLVMLHLAGWIMMACVLAFPTYAFPLVWISVFFIIDPLATFAGGRSIGWHLRRDDWSPVFNIATGTVLCGFFWELWNMFALPKWTYAIPYAEFGHVFEMPILGYGGYIPFGLEIYSTIALVSALLRTSRIPLPAVSSVTSN
jgi:hypothetical protein